MSKRLVIIGASGHGKVIADIALKVGYEIIGFLDDDALLKEVCGFPVLGNIMKIDHYKDECEFVIAIGNNTIREKIAKQYDMNWTTLVHPAAIIGRDVQIEEGTVVMANAVINSSSHIGKHCIINTGAVVEHDNFLQDYVHVSPNATLAGTVHLGERVHVGVGACVKNNVTVIEDVVIGAGAAVVKDITETGVYVGVPARRIR